MTPSAWARLRAGVGVVKGPPADAIEDCERLYDASPYTAGFGKPVWWDGSKFALSPAAEPAAGDFQWHAVNPQPIRFSKREVEIESRRVTERTARVTRAPRLKRQKCERKRRRITRRFVRTS